jgi:membrane protease YdiL (CAAX protease family)
MNDATHADGRATWHDPERLPDIATAAALLAIHTALLSTGPALTNSNAQYAVVKAVFVAAMLLVAARSRIAAVGLPVTPHRYRQKVPFLQAHRRLEVVALTATTICVSFFIRITELLAEYIWPPNDPDCDGTIDAACCNYNDPACSGDSAGTDLLGVFNASVGEELLYRVALFTVIARFTSVRIALIVQAIIFGLSHTGFDKGYGAPAVIGLIAVGSVYALSVLATRSVWPAIAAHALHNLAVTAKERDLVGLEALTWVLTMLCIGVGTLVIVLPLTSDQPITRLLRRFRSRTLD